MKKYQLITLTQARSLSLEQLVQEYNDAVETIWHLQNKIAEQMQENEKLWEAYEQVSNELYG